MEDNKINILIFNNQALGDMILGTHLATVIKQDIPDCHITFAIPDNSMLTMSTNNHDKGLFEMMEILALQPNIDCFALFNNEKQGIIPVSGIKPEKEFDKIYTQSEWWSDLGIAASMMIPYYRDKLSEKEFSSLNRKDINTETKFNVCSEKITSKYSIPTIATAGPLDWNNKYKSEERRQEVLKGIESIAPDIRIIMLGADIGDRTYLQSLQILNNCKLYLGPEGSMSHIAAGLGIDTISLSSIYPREWLSPKYYHSGYHIDIVPRAEDTCDSFNCIKRKDFDYTQPQGWGNPPCQFSTWPHTCPYTKNGWSCIHNIKVEDILNEFEIWYKERYNK